MARVGRDEGSDGRRVVTKALPKCDKRAYRSVGAAKRAHTKAGFRIRVYKCELCGLLHVTASEKEGAARG